MPEPSNWVRRLAPTRDTWLSLAALAGAALVFVAVATELPPAAQAAATTAGPATASPGQPAVTDRARDSGADALAGGLRASR